MVKSKEPFSSYITPPLVVPLVAVAIVGMLAICVEMST